MREKNIKIIIVLWIISICSLLLGIIPIGRSVCGIGSYINASWFAEDLYSNLQSYALSSYIVILCGEILLIISGILCMPVKPINRFWLKVQTKVSILGPWICVVTGFVGHCIQMKGIWS